MRFIVMLSPFHVPSTRHHRILRHSKAHALILIKHPNTHRYRRICAVLSDEEPGLSPPREGRNAGADMLARMDSVCRALLARARGHSSLPPGLQASEHEAVEDQLQELDAQSC